MGHKLVSMKFYNVQWHSFHCACIRTLGEIGNANCTSFTTKLLLFAVCQMGNYTSMYVTFDRFPFDLLYHCQFKRPHHSPHNEVEGISKSQLISFQPKISREISKIVTLLQNHKKLSGVSLWMLKEYKYKSEDLIEVSVLLWHTVLLRRNTELVGTPGRSVASKSGVTIAIQYGHTYTHLYDIQRSFSYMYNCTSVPTRRDVHLPPDEPPRAAYRPPPSKAATAVFQRRWLE